MHAAFAAAPLVLACVLLAAKVSAPRAAAVSLVCAVLVAVFVFPIPAAPAWSTARSLGPTALEVLVILLGGVVLSEILSASGAQHQLATWVQQCCADPGRAVLLIVLGITPFVESITGFGVGVVVAVPLLRHIGLPAGKAAVLGLLGLVIVPWGALAPGTLVAAQLGGVPFDELGVRSAVLSGPVFAIMGGAALVVACGWRSARAHGPDLLLVAGTLWTAVWATNRLIGTPLAGAIGSLATIAVTLALSRIRDQVSLGLDGPTWHALRPYGLLVAGLLSSSVVVMAVGAEGPWELVASPSTWLMITCLATPLLVGLRGTELSAAVMTALRRWWPIAVATALFLTLGGVLTATGMSTTLAQAASQLGPVYLFLVPFLGGLGGFIAGSNAGANAMFAASQAQAAHVLGADVTQVVGMQNVSASLLTMAAPPRVALAASLATAPTGTLAPTHRAASQQADTSMRWSSAEPPALEQVSASSTLRVVLAADVAVLVVLGALNVLLS